MGRGVRQVAGDQAPLKSTYSFAILNDQSMRACSTTILQTAYTHMINHPTQQRTNEHNKQPDTKKQSVAAVTQSRQLHPDKDGPVSSSTGRTTVSLCVRNKKLMYLCIMIRHVTRRRKKVNHDSVRSPRQTGVTAGTTTTNRTPSTVNDQLLQ